MARYIINKNEQSNGDHEVHNLTSGCPHMPLTQNQVDLGFHSNCHGAIFAAKLRWPGNKINGCFYCCNECHTT